MSYAVKEMFLTLQGEGMQAGRRAVFLRFAGCNLWSGREQDRASAVCNFCDTDFLGTDGENGARYDSPGSLAEKAGELWGDDRDCAYVVCTGGEPLLQLDTPLIEAFHDAGFEIAVESNGTIEAPDGIDWLCVSPKADSVILQRSGQELKLVWPQPDVEPANFLDWDFEHFLIQPMDCVEADAARDAAMAYVRDNPQWRLSLQTHKMLGIP